MSTSTSTDNRSSLEVDNPEALREALLNLERLREQEKLARQQMEALVGGLHVLNECQTVNSMYREILDCLHGLIQFDAASILVEDQSGFLSTAIASDPRLRYKDVPIQGVFKRCLSGRATTLTDLTLVPDWPKNQHVTTHEQEQSTGTEVPLKSALLVSLPALHARMILICASETASKLKRKELELLRSFSPLATQAVRRAMEMEKLNYLVTTLDHQAHFDLLTGLPNRTFLEQKLNTLAGSDTSVSVLFLDLDNFKTINDTFGHAVGDILLSEIAFRMSSVMGENDTAARMGGDEFALLIRSRTTQTEIQLFCNELLDMIHKPLYLRNGRIVPSASIGVLFSANTTDPGQLNMQKADIAMYSAKSLGRNQYCFFNDEMKEKVQAEFDIESQLPLAIKQNRFHLVYQPIVAANAMCCDHLEVLVRWHEGGQNVYGPNQFIPIAEKTGDIIELGKWIIQQAMSECRSWLLQSPDNTLSINVSQVQLKRSNFASEFIQLVSTPGVNLNQLELELSENIIADCVEDVVSQNISALNQNGIRFAFDDFGTGSSSLLHLQKFPGTCLKIDKSFVDNIVVSEEDRRLVAGMIDFAHHMKMEVVAEGVESQNQLDILIELGTDYIQGYLLARPEQAEQIFSLLQQWDRSSANCRVNTTGT